LVINFLHFKIFYEILDVLIYIFCPYICMRTLKSKILSSVAIKWHQFKSKLTSIYVYDARKGESPCLKYTCIAEETWQQFVHI